MKAFYPSKPPFPLLHVDTTWKFREMIAHRDSIVERYGVKLLVHTNPEGIARGISPIASGSQLHTQVMKTDALKQALDKYGFDAAFGGARRDEEKSRAKERVFSFRSAGPRVGSAQSAARALAALQHAHQQGRDDPRLPAVELDRARHLAVHARREHSGRAAVLRSEAAGGEARRRC